MFENIHFVLYPCFHRIFFHLIIFNDVEYKIYAAFIKMYILCSVRIIFIESFLISIV